MKKTISAVLLLATFLFSIEACSLTLSVDSGRYKTNIAELNFLLFTSGRASWGEGAYDGSEVNRASGKLVGDYDATLNLFTGHWVQTVSDKKCKNVKHNSYYWGTVRLKFKASQDNKKREVTGAWGHCGSAPTNPWKGTKVSQLPSFTNISSRAYTTLVSIKGAREAVQLSRTKHLREKRDRLLEKFKFSNLKELEEWKRIKLDGIKGYIDPKNVSALVKQARDASAAPTVRAAAQAKLQGDMDARLTRNKIWDDFDEQRKIWYLYKAADAEWWKSRRWDPDYKPAFGTDNFYPTGEDDPNRLLWQILRRGNS